MYEGKRAVSFFPWQNRAPNPITVERKLRRHGRFYDVMTDGSIRRPDHQRHERKVLGLSARQHGRLKKRLKREEKGGDQ